MKPLKLIPFLLFILNLSFLSCYGQKERNIWCFGDSVELNFNSGSPVSDSGCVINTSEGCASIADKNTGQLLFYTDGITVYNSFNDIMPGDTLPLGGNFSTTQSAFILPMPGSNHQYYIFCTDAQAGQTGTTGDSGTQYCIIDMYIDGGLGDIEQQPTPLLKPTCEKIAAAIMPDSLGYWVVLHLWNSDAFYAYPVTVTGIDTPVVSHTGIVHKDNPIYGDGDGAAGYMRISPDRSKIAVAITTSFTVQVFNFNDATGLISAPIFSDTNFGIDGSPYGLCFSPNGQLLYVSDDYIGVYQYNLAANDSVAIMASKTLVSDNGRATALQLGPDQKIYVAVESGYFLDRINNPDNLGIACAYELNAVQLNYGLCVVGMPEFPPEFNSNCQSLSISIVVIGDTLIAYGFAAYQWYLDSNSIPNATSPAYIANQPGSYSVEVTDSNGCTGISNQFVITGINNLEGDALVSIYPNPCSVSSFQFIVSNQLIGSQLQMYNAVGQLVYQSAIRNLQSEIPVTGLAAGVYFLSIAPSVTTLGVSGPVVRKLVKL